VLNTIILLTGPIEQPFLSSVLLKHNPGLTVRPVSTLDEVTALEPELLRRARLIAFVTPVVVPPKALNQLGYGAYNFHPGPPHFPGWAPAHFAVYHQATEFGATAHVMTKRVDDGPIVGVESFCIPANITVSGLDSLAYAHLARLFWQLAKALAIQIEPLAELPIRWSGTKTSRRHFAAMCDIPLDISKDEFDHRIKAFGGNHFGINLTINLHGIQFLLASTVPCDLSPPHEAERQLSRADLNRQEHAA
jgi:methionyl-tRNA formyltransferase